MDLTTAAAATSHVVTIDSPSVTLDSDVLNAVRSRLHIRTWPEGASVPISLEYRVPDGAHRLAWDHRILIACSEELIPRWYELVVSAGASICVERPDGSCADEFRARFRVDSHPVAQRLQLERGRGETDIVLEWSERLIAGESPWIVQTEDGPVGCRVDVTDVDSVFLSADNGGVAHDTLDIQMQRVLAATSRVRLRCPTDAVILGEIAVPSDVTTALGTPVFGTRDVTPARLEWQVMNNEEPVDLGLEAPGAR